MREITTLLAFCVFATPLAGQSSSSWYIVRIDGSPVGWMRDTRTDTAATIRTSSTTYMALNRLGSRVVIETAIATTEAPSGALRSLDVGSRTSDQRINTTVVVNGRAATVGVEAGARRFDRTIALADSLLGPDAVRRLTLARLRTVGDSVTFTAWDGQLNAPATVTRVAIARDSLLTLIERSTATPLATTIQLDKHGRTVNTQFDLPFGRVAIGRADSAAALAASGGGSLSEESYTRTLVRTGIRLPRAREIDRLRVRLEWTANGDGSRRDSFPNLAGPGQRVLARDRSSSTIETSRRRPRTTSVFPVAATSELRDYLSPNAYIQSDEPRLVALARRVVGSERDTFRAAVLLQRWVADSMQFDLGVAFAPSVEVFEQRRGTCVAYATLLATLARAVGIPSRIAMGYAYVNAIFGGHAWTEVLVGNDWVPIDAALVSDGPADAARFAFAWSSLAGGPGELTSGPATQLYGRLRARVEGFTIDGTRRDVAAGAAPYGIEGDRYRNDWLGLEITKPAGFRLVELDETWPSATVVAMERGAERVRVLLEPRRPWAPIPSGEDVIPAGLHVWRFEVESRDAAALLREVRRGVKTR